MNWFSRIIQTHFTKLSVAIKADPLHIINGIIVSKLIVTYVGNNVPSMSDTAYEKDNKITRRNIRNSIFSSDKKIWFSFSLSHKWDKDYSSLLSMFNLPTLSTRRFISKLCLLYKITNNLLYFPSNIFIRKPLPSYTSRHFDPLTFTISFSHLSASQNSFVPSVLSLWNSLPYHVKSSSSLNTFKSKINILFY